MVHWGNSLNLLDSDGTLTPVDFGTSLWDKSIEWARFHGLDPMRIPAGSVVERDPKRYEIRYVEFVMDTDGGPLVRDNDVVTEPRAERGEGPPLPFPRNEENS